MNDQPPSDTVLADLDLEGTFGTGFDVFVPELEADVPDGADPRDLFAYCLMLGDDALVFTQRLIGWCTRAPELEVEVALANFGLDLLGQARLLLGRAGHVERAGRDEDALAFLRGPEAYRNVRFAEDAHADFADCVLRLLVFSTWRGVLLSRLTSAPDLALAAVSVRGVRELAYHREFAAHWTARLGDGTERSRRRTLRAWRGLRPLLQELFVTHDVERRLAAAGCAVPAADLRAEVEQALAAALAPADIALYDPVAPAVPGPRATGRDSRPGDALTELLTEMQSVARAYPGAVW
ncbi:1,2-phenylacetyl-CoA epoxidase subunit PaaC [Streptomyces sp. NPDC004542]|uniref:1,2-phenylacetyl-CoA epoxidase subunit PaaC n=1 Tax=Streptomyces sp. NPDC004542 TaxID=3154281 RepID=UPI00339F31A1